MSTASESFSTRPTVDNNETKPSSFLEFWEQRSKFKSWTVICELYFHVTGLFSERKIVFVIGYFRDKINEWIKFQSKIFLSENKDNTVWRFFLDWKTFKLETKYVFSIINDNKIIK